MNHRCIMKRFSFLLAVVFTITLNAQSNQSQKDPVKLVLQLTVDQLRGDIINKFKDKFVDNGINYLLREGLFFTDAHFQHAVTKTAPGHATLATGTSPSSHGIIGNDWYDINTKKSIYNSEDSNHAVFNMPKEKIGRSPKNLLASTTADEIAASRNFQSKVFTVSVKDRGAIFLAGFSGKAFWYNYNEGNFTTSNYYYDEIPNWVNEWSNKKLTDKLIEEGWDLLLERSKYIYPDETSYEKTIEELGNTFPYNLSKIDRKDMYDLLPYTPIGDKITADFAEAIITNEGLGQDDIVDYLSISFSCTDYIGHLFSPTTMEYEDQILNLDRTLEKFFSFIDEKIGLDNVLIVLSADHGVCDAPEYLLENGFEFAGVAVVGGLIEKINNFGKEKYNLKSNLVLKSMVPYYYLDENLLEENNIDICKIEREIRDIILEVDGIYEVYTSCEILNQHNPNDEIFEKVKKSFYKGRSGQIYIVPKPFYYITSKSEYRGSAATHGSPWNYDTYVPIIFVGPGVQKGFSNIQASPKDISKSICNYLGIKSPSSADGKALLNSAK